MKNITISKELLAVNPNITLLCFTYSVKVERENAKVWEQINGVTIPEVEKKYTLENLSEMVEIAAARETYKALGKEPSRYRVSSEALMRRILQGKGLYKVNNVVDFNNLVSIESGLSCGSYDLDKLEGGLEFRIGKAGEEYKGIGKEMINIENLPVFADEMGTYGSPTSDSERSMITSETKNVMTVMISFSGREVLEKNAERVEEWLREMLGVEANQVKNFT
ncbi:MAG: hypothetical protein LBG64_02560 [Pseudomonadales bacterium]|jgi:DNA/RNA-binding domain of Phe-tRNA-synthetase-like protein|nr:hypothetical protein [Pseudomonadales bacterium]